MLTFCFDEVYCRGDSLTVKISPANRNRPIYSYWIAMCCLLAPDKLSVIGAEQIEDPTATFVYVVEVHWNVIEWCSFATEDQIVELPPQVVRAIHERRAAVLISFAHEGRRLYEGNGSPDDGCVLDKLAMLSERYGMLPEQLWFVTGNLFGNEEAQDWLLARGGGSLPFVVRCHEISSFGIGLVTRERFLRGRGINSCLVAEPHLGMYSHLAFQQFKVALVRQPFSALGVGDHGDRGEPPWRYGSLNRRFRPHRWWLVTRLFGEGLLGSGQVTFPQVGPWELSQVGCEPIPAELLPLVELLPMQLDAAWAKSSWNQFLAQNTYAVTTTPPEVARDCAIEIVTESFYGEGRFITEKTFKALLGRGPAVVVGPWGSLAYLRSIGVETWNDVIDESYDLVEAPQGNPWDTARFDACMDTVLPIIRDGEAIRRIDRACKSQRAHNLRWLIDAPKPWDHLIRELEDTLASL